MKKLIGVLSIITLFCAGVEAATLNVTVKDQNGTAIQGAKIMLTTYTEENGMYRPDVSLSTVGVTNGSGSWSGTVTPQMMPAPRSWWRDYQLFVSFQGYAPTVRQQQMDWQYGQQWVWVVPTDSDTSITKNVTLHPDLTLTSQSKISFTVKNSTVSALMYCEVRNPNTWESIASGMSVVASATHIVQIDNVPYSSVTGAYKLNVYFPAYNNGMEKSVSDMQVPDFNFASNSGMPPPINSNTDITGNVAFEGVIQTTNSVAIPNMRVMLFTQTQNGQSYQTMSDDNGYFAFYDTLGLIDKETYGLEIQAMGYEGKRHTSLIYNVDVSSSLGVIKLDRVYGEIEGVVKLDGIVLPNVNVNAWGDWSAWFPSYGASVAEQNSGRGSGNTQSDDSNGTFKIQGLAPGNYRLEIYSDFSQQPYNFNNGLDRQENIDTSGDWPQPHLSTSDDYRVTISNLPWETKIYDAAGNDVTVSSYPLVINIPANKEAGGTISGTITYDESLVSPEVDIGGSGNTFIIIARQDWSTYQPSTSPGEWTPPACGFTSVEGSGEKFDYEIHVPVGYLYQIEVKTKRFGIIRGDGRDIKADLRNGVTSVSNINFDISQGGMIRGVLKMPDGSVFKPIFGDEQTSKSANINANGWNTRSWGYSQVKEDGTFEIAGILPGSYSIEANGWGGAYEWASPKIKDILVNPVGTDVNNPVYSQVEVKLKPGIRCYPFITSDAAFGSSKIPEGSKLKVIRVPQGTKLTFEVLKDLLFSEGADQGSFYQSNTDGAVLPFFEPKFLAYGVYDFYVLLSFEEEKDEDFSPESMATLFLGEAKGVEVNEEARTATTPADHPWQKNQPCVPITIDTKIGDAIIGGKMVGQNIFRQADMVEMAKNFDVFIDYIPAVVLYDSSGTIKACTMEVPEDNEQANYWETAVYAGDYSKLMDALVKYPPRYAIRYIPEGVYTFVAATPNYPPVVKQINITGTVTQNIDFDQEGSGGSIKGIVKDKATGAALANTNVLLISNMVNKNVLTDSAGAYEFNGLPKGRFVMQVSKNGYALVGARRELEKNSSVQVNFNLELAPGSFSGTVYLQKMPSPRVFSGAKIAAYDDTFNGLYPNEYLPANSAATDANGKYTISGVLDGHVYKIFLMVDGKQLEWVEKTATTGELAGIDFVLRSEAPKLEIKTKISSDKNSIGFMIKSQKTLVSLPVGYYQEGTVFDANEQYSTVTVTSRPNNEYRALITPSDRTKEYVLRLEADDGVNEKDIVDTIFSLSLTAKVKKKIKQEFVSGGDVYMDDDANDLTSIGIYTGGLTPTDNSASSPSLQGSVSPNAAVGGFITTLPGVQISKQTRSTSSMLLDIISSVIASDMYTIDITSAQVNRELTLSLNYDKTQVTDFDSLRIYQYNSQTGSWDIVSGTTMIDPITGTISVDVDSISNASEMAAPRMRGKSLFDGKRHVINPLSETSQSGTFAVFNAAPPNVKTYTGSEFKAYNFPNPFNLQSKTLTLTDDITTGTTMDTQGTIIKYYVPSSVSGKTVIYIYNLAGEMVRQIDEGEKDGGYIYYTEWDGKNDNGSSIASGVYFCMFQVNGKKKKTFKMAVIK